MQERPFQVLDNSKNLKNFDKEITELENFIKKASNECVDYDAIIGIMMQYGP